VHSSGESATLTGIRRRRASTDMRRFSARSGVAAKTSSASSNWSGWNAPRRTASSPRAERSSTGGENSFATTVTRAPAASSASIFRVPTAPAPTTRTLAPRTSWKTGRYLRIGLMAASQEIFGRVGPERVGENGSATCAYFAWNSFSTFLSTGRNPNFA